MGEVVRMCLEDWELEQSIIKLNTARTTVARLDKEKRDAHSAHMTELQSLRDRMMKLERKTPIEFVIPAGDLIFYDPTSYLEPDIQAHVKEIVEYKVRQELSNVDGLTDDTPALKERIKELEAQVKELEERLKETTEELEEASPSGLGGTLGRKGLGGTLKGAKAER